MKILYWIIGIVIIAGLAYWLINGRTANPANNSLTNQNTAVTNQPTQSNSTAAIFTNTKFHYSFVYDATAYKLDSANLANVTVSDSNSTSDGYWELNIVSSTGATKALTALGQDLYNQYKPLATSEYTASDMTLSDTTIGGVAAKKLVIDAKKYGDGHNTWIVVKNGDTVYTIRANSSTVVDKILNSFKFI